MYPNDYLNKEDSSSIYFFCSPYEPLNNWSAHRVKLWGKNFPTAEHAYHFKKYDMTVEDVAELILASPSPWAATKLANAHKAQMRDDWHEIKISIMREILEAKANQNEDVAGLLNKSKGKTIIENSPWNSFWGCGKDGMGENHIGKIWMAIRDSKDPKSV